MRILEILQANSDLPLSDVAKQCGLSSPSAISKRVRKLRELGLIKKNISVLDYKALGYTFITVTLVKGKYGKDYTRKLAQKLSNISNAVMLLEILGDIDFILVTMNRSQDDYKSTLSYIMSLDEIERSDTRVVINIDKFFDFSGIKLIGRDLTAHKAIDR